jgi:CRP-like cAMP-binding protein
MERRSGADRRTARNEYLNAVSPSETMRERPTCGMTSAPVSVESLTQHFTDAGARSLCKEAKGTLFIQGERASHIYFVIQGRLQCSVNSAHGRIGTIALYAAGDFLGEVSLIAQPHPHSATATTDCELLALESARMQNLLQTDQRVASYFTNFLLRRTLETQADLVDQLLNPTEKRLARVLLLLSNYECAGSPEPITQVTHDMLAHRVGTTRARITYFMNKFRNTGLIEYRHGEIKVRKGLSYLLRDELDE